MPRPANKKAARKKQLAEARQRKKQKADEAAEAEARLAAPAASEHEHAVGPSDDSGYEERSAEAYEGMSETTESTTSEEDARRAKRAEGLRKRRETIAVQRSQPPSRASTRSAAKPQNFAAEQAAAAAETSNAHAKMWETRRANENAKRLAEREKTDAEMELLVNDKVEKLRANLLAELSIEQVAKRAEDIRQMKELEDGWRNNFFCQERRLRVAEENARIREIEMAEKLKNRDDEHQKDQTILQQHITSLVTELKSAYGEIKLLNDSAAEMEQRMSLLEIVAITARQPVRRRPRQVERRTNSKNFRRN